MIKSKIVTFIISFICLIQITGCNSYRTLTLDSVDMISLSKLHENREIVIVNNLSDSSQYYAENFKILGDTIYCNLKTANLIAHKTHVKKFRNIGVYDGKTGELVSDKLKLEPKKVIHIILFKMDLKEGPIKIVSDEIIDIQFHKKNKAVPIVITAGIGLVAVIIVALTFTLSVSLGGL